MDTQEHNLVRQSAGGDKQAFSMLVEKYQNLVFTVCFRYLGNREDAHDAAQETFIKAYKGLQKFRKEASFKTWVTKIAANVCRDRLRRKKNNTVSLDETIFQGEIRYGESVADDPEKSPDAIFEAKETSAYLQGLLDMLTPEYRMMVVMRDIQGMKYEEIASELDVSLGTVKSRLNRARRALRDQILRDRELSGHNLRLTK